MARRLSERDSRIAKFMKRVGEAIESGDVVASDVWQAITAKDNYTIDCPLQETSLGGGTGNIGRVLLDEMGEIHNTPDPPPRVG